MALKIVIGLKTGKTFQKELPKEEAEALYMKVLGEEINGELINIPGAKFVISGGSDYTGIPMRRDLDGIKRKRILLSKSIGFKGKLRKKRFGGLRVKKTIAGNTIYEKTHQLNLKCLSGEKKVEEMFKPKEEEKPKEENKEN